MLLLGLKRTKNFVANKLSRPLFFVCFLPVCVLVGGFSSVTVAADTLASAKVGRVSKVCDFICHGQFEAAGELLKQLDQNTDSLRLSAVVREYNNIQQERASKRQTAYQQQLLELKKLQYPDVNDVNGPYESNDVNDISRAMSVITKASASAESSVRQAFLDKPFVKRVFDDAMNMASQYESQGKWIDAYIHCYSWLQVIYKDNKAYTDYSQQLLDKAAVAGSFVDSPCETSQQRYAGVEKQMFIQAISILNFNYVTIVPYRQMAIKAVKRCQYLTDVIRLSLPRILEKVSGDSSGTVNLPFVTMPDKSALALWSQQLDKIFVRVERSATGMNKGMFINVFNEVLKLNDRTISIPQTILVAHFTEGAFEALDPYTAMIWPRQTEDFEKSMTNTFTGIGIEISKRKGRLTVSSLLFDTPAFNSGAIDAGDVIEAVDGLETKDMSLPCAVKNITGPEGTKVVLTIRHPASDKTEDVTITRARVIIPTIRGWQRTEEGKWRYFINEQEKIGYVRIASFSSKTPFDFQKVLGQLESQGMKALIIDLRRNPGGLLSAAAQIADMFIRDGLLVSTRPRMGFGSYLSAHRKDTHSSYPLVVLVDGGSASASEIVAGALADPKYNRAILVGERTFGKGSVQTITSRVGGGSQLKYTMAHYYLPSGQRVKSKEQVKKEGNKDWGVGPHIEIKLNNDELKQKYETQRDNDVLVKTGHDDNGAYKLSKHTAQQTLKSDPQLAIAVLVARSRIIQSGAD